MWNINDERFRGALNHLLNNREYKDYKDGYQPFRTFVRRGEELPENERLPLYTGFNNKIVNGRMRLTNNIHSNPMFMQWRPKRKRLVVRSDFRFKDIVKEVAEANGWKYAEVDNINFNHNFFTVLNLKSQKSREREMASLDQLYEYASGAYTRPMRVVTTFDSWI